MVRSTLWLLAALTLASTPFPQTPIGAAGGLRPEATRTQRTWIVDANGGGDFVDLQVAIDTVRSGDVLLLRSNFTVYETISIDGKALTLVGDGEQAHISRSGVNPVSHLLSIQNLASDQDVLLRNIRIAGSVFSFETTWAFWFENNEGPIWIEDCRFTAPGAVPFNHGGWQGMMVRDCDTLTMIRSSLNGAGALTTGLVALRAIRSNVHLYESEINGPPGEYLTGASWPGGDAIELRSSFLFASQSQLSGGRGGPCSCYNFAEAGGPGLDCGALSTAQLVGTVVEAGPTGGVINPNCPGGTNCVDPVPAVPIVGAGVVDSIPGPTRSYVVEPTARVGGAANVTIEGPPGELVLSLVGGEPDGETYLPLHLGVQLPQPPFEIRTEGLIPASGTLDVLLPVPALPSGGAERLFLQGFFFPPSGEAYLGSGSAIVLVD